MNFEYWREQGLAGVLFSVALLLAGLLMIASVIMGWKLAFPLQLFSLAVGLFLGFYIGRRSKGERL